MWTLSAIGIREKRYHLQGIPRLYTLILIFCLLNIYYSIQNFYQPHIISDLYCQYTGVIKYYTF